MNFVSSFSYTFFNYAIEVLPALAVGFLISGVIHEFIPQNIIDKYLNRGGIKPIFYTTIIGIILPVCCIGSLPIAVGMRKKGVATGPILAFLVATPATSVSAIIVSLKFLGVFFTLWLTLTVVVLGLAIGILGNLFNIPAQGTGSNTCPMCEEGHHKNHFHHSTGFSKRIKSVFTYAFIDMPKEIGVEILLGLVVASAISSIKIFSTIISKNFSGGWGYVFSLIFGLLMYVCSTASVPMVDAFLKAGLSDGAGMVLLLAGPVTSYGTLLVIKKTFGGKILVFYLAVISAFSLLSGWVFQIVK